ALTAEVANQACCLKLRKKSFQNDVVDGRWADVTQTCPAGEPRKAVPDCHVVCGVKERRPGAVELDAGSLEHRLQSRRRMGRRKVAAHMCPPFAGASGRRGEGVQRRADGGDVERDRRERLADELCIDREGRTQIPLATWAKVWTGRNSIGRVLERDRRGDSKNGFFLH